MLIIVPHGFYRWKVLRPYSAKPHAISGVPNKILSTENPTTSDCLVAHRTSAPSVSRRVTYKSFKPGLPLFVRGNSSVRPAHIRTTSIPILRILDSERTLGCTLQLISSWEQTLKAKDYNTRETGPVAQLGCVAMQRQRAHD